MSDESTVGVGEHDPKAIWEIGYAAGYLYRATEIDAEISRLRADLGTASDTIDRQGWEIDRLRETEEAARAMVAAWAEGTDYDLRMGALRAALVRVWREVGR
jgi:hypothetical protein